MILKTVAVVCRVAVLPFVFLSFLCAMSEGRWLLAFMEFAYLGHHAHPAAFRAAVEIFGKACPVSRADLD